MSKLFFTALGVGLILISANDAYVTILHSRGRNGPISHVLCRSIWRAARAIAFKLSRKQRHKRLNSVGPLLMPMLIGGFIILLVLGFALVYYPRMTSDFTINREAPIAPWIESLYFSGVTLTTLGFGDIVPRTDWMRVVAIIESGAGFGLMSLAITYVVAVYRALERKRTAALAFYHQAEGGPDAVGFIDNHFVAGKLSGLAPSLRTAARDLQEMLESHIEHPIIHYFHPMEVFKSTPRVLFLSLEICAVIRSCLDPQVYADTQERPEVRTLESSAMHVLKEFVVLLELDKRAGRRGESRFHESRRWETRFDRAMAGLEKAGIETTGDRAAGLMTYQALRGEWEEALFKLASYLGYDWDEVTGDLNVLYAPADRTRQPRIEALK
ncbi:MAG TPA: potassium channel family protein [Blastocatellia bacterium]|nr:potassium channel family protein [Blastocatellia bacterium]